MNSDQKKDDDSGIVEQEDERGGFSEGSQEVEFGKSANNGGGFSEESQEVEKGL